MIGHWETGHLGLVIGNNGDQWLVTVINGLVTGINGDQWFIIRINGDHWLVIGLVTGK